MTRQHGTVNMEWNEVSADNFESLNAEQCAAMARIFNHQSKRLAEAEFASTILQDVIESLTGMDSIKACLKVYGVDFIAMSKE